MPRSPDISFEPKLGVVMSLWIPTMASLIVPQFVGIS